MSDQSDERDGAQETAVGHQVVGESGAVPASDADPAVPENAPEQGHQTEATEVFFSRDQAQEQHGAAAPPTPPPPSSEPSGGGSSPAEADRIAADQQDSFAQNPLPYVGGAFVGAFVVAQILKRITGGND